MTDQSKPTEWTGAWVAAILTAPLLAVLFAAAQWVGTPFVPFDVFDWMGRVLPGPLITFGIDSIVAVIRAFDLGSTSSTAKLAEQIMAVAGLFVTNAIAGALLYAVLRRRPSITTSLMPGIITGLAVGLPVALITLAVNLNATQPPFVNALWILLTFAAWGIALSVVYFRLQATAPAAGTAPNSLEAIDRRNFIVRLGTATAAVTVVGAGLGSVLNTGTSTNPQPQAASTDLESPTSPWSASNTLPNANDPLIPAAGTRPELTPLAEHYRIDINTVPPTIRESDWLLTFTGLVDEPVEMTLADLKSNYEPLHQFVTLSCISNYIAGDLIGTTRWTGASLRDVLADVPLKPTAKYLKITAADNFDEFIDLKTVFDDPRVMLTYAWDGLPLEVKHGFPLRIYIPDHFGMKQPKWITSIEAVEEWQEGWWVRRGWDPNAYMRATSVIDTVAVSDTFTAEDGQQFVPVGGIAHAGDRGISKVEVQVDDGEWVEAQLRQPLSETTWVIWRYDWPFQSGNHKFSVRCTESNGTAQNPNPAGSRPSGATGIHSVFQSV
ncbi:MAG: molybdopterin-dependent oxidoreductase [Anaerolineae bacterium]|nr:molybdopterin-dependent oxidoreductase [Anaerolineae bacterium]